MVVYSLPIELMAGGVPTDVKLAQSTVKRDKIALSFLNDEESGTG